MSEKRRGLGRGLGSLIPTGPEPGTTRTGERPVDVFFGDREDQSGPTGAGEGGGPFLPARTA